MPSGSAALTSAPALASARAASGAAVARGVHQRRPVAVRQDREHALEAEPILGKLNRRRPRVDVGAAAGEQRDDVGVILGRRPHQRRLAELRFAGVDVGAAIEQHLHGRGVSGSRRRHQHGLSFGHDRVGARAGGEQRLDHRGVAVDGGQRQRRHAVAVRRAGVGAGAEERLRRLEIVGSEPPSEAASCRRPRWLSPPPGSSEASGLLRGLPAWIASASRDSLRPALSDADRQAERRGRTRGTYRMARLIS